MKSIAMDVERNRICFERDSIQAYKEDCEICKHDLFETQKALEEALQSNKEGIEFYQEKPFVIFLGTVATLLGVFAFSAK